MYIDNTLAKIKIYNIEMQNYKKVMKDIYILKY